MSIDHMRLPTNGSTHSGAVIVNADAMRLCEKVGIISEG